MREEHGSNGRVSTKFKAILAALVAVFAIGAFGTSQATAAQQLELSFNDAWIGVPSLADLGAGSFHAVDPDDTEGTSIDFTADLAANGDISAPAAAFQFPTQSIPAGDPIGDIDLNIVAREDITGNYAQDTGALTVNLSLRLEIDAPGLGLKCELQPLNLALASSGSYTFVEGVPADGEEPAVEEVTKSGANFAGGNGAVLGDWSGLTADDVMQVPPPLDGEGEYDPTQDVCKMVIGGLIGDSGGDPENPPTFDGVIWLGGTATVTGEPDVTECPEGQVGTYPDCSDPVVEPKPAKLGAFNVTPKKKAVKKGKKVVLKLKVRNIGGKNLKGKVKIQAPKAKVNVRKQVQVNVKPGKVQTVKVPVKVKKTKKARGNAKVVLKFKGKKAVATIKIKK